jgi:hypothetical protein
MEVDTAEKVSIPEAVIRPNPNPQVASLVTEWYERTDRVKAATARYKEETEYDVSRIQEITEALLAHAKENKLDRIKGDEAVLDVVPSTSNQIDARKLLKFLAENGRRAEFLDVIKVQVTEALKTFGEKALLAAGVLTQKVENYARLSPPKKNRSRKR